MTATRRLAHFASSLTYADLPGEAVAIAKRLVLDSLGTALAATTLGDGCREVADAMAALGGTPESTILGRGAKVSMANAAFANGALAHALNYDAVGPTTGHVGAIALTPALAAAEAFAPVDGRTFLAAVAAAAEVTARTISAVANGGGRVSPRILSGQYFGYLGAAAGAGRILGLDAQAMHSAFGLAAMQAAGSRQVLIGGDVPAKAIYAAFPNQVGALAALLARAGLDARFDVLEGEAGLFGIAADGRFDAPTLTADLGRRFLFLDAQFKPWPTSANVAPFIEAAIELNARHHVTPADLQSVELTGASRYRDWFEPVRERRRPANATAAANSAMFVTAKALVHGGVSLRDFTAEGLADEPSLQVADRITYRLDDSVRGGIVKVTTTDGRELVAAIGAPLGDASRPLTDERLEAKFRDCCSYAPSIAPAQAERMIAFVRNLDRAEDVSRLLA